MTHPNLSKALAAVLLALLAACGGGGSEDEPSEETPRVDCQANPKLCA